ncbi:DNA polymerase subunit gamma-2, mitochondrial isoform X1 [Frankliniella occidentalis]|uniref:DNA polymerase subunit gamma-2, mitochondrial isoform X1 n=1 Tax=Frankliniella occidentalis TaxID=133901 RepID=A0A6J1S5G4_FRAOC|nr:DNA polymerase subunit gamma-2, mitochondrial isoform X1 [Frankliniella occidentalis]
MSLKKILHLCEKHGFVKPLWHGSEVTRLNFGPVGEFLVNNVRQEWHYSSVVNRDENFYPVQSRLNRSDGLTNDFDGIHETYDHIKSLCNGTLPFGIAQTIADDNLMLKNRLQAEQPHQVFKPDHQTFLRSLLFVSPNDGRQAFYTWQQKRKMWWRKFSSHPGRFSLSDIKESGMNDKINDSSDLMVNILAEFDWGSTTIETIRLLPLNLGDLSDKQIEILKAKDGRKQVLPFLVECILSLEIASLVFLCDAFLENSRRQLLRLHRRLSPIKAGFVISLTDSTVADRLLDVARHLSRSLRQNGLTTLLLSDIAKKSHDSQLARNDEMGIPFTIVLTDSTLNDGIIWMYSRETTLKEQVHISKVPEYMTLLVKNY